MDEGSKLLLEWFEAARRGDKLALESMLLEGFWADAISPLDGMSALMVAAKEMRSDCVELLAGESTVDMRDEFGNTALIWAASAGDAASVGVLVAAGADKMAKNKFGLDAQGAWRRRGRVGDCFEPPI